MEKLTEIASRMACSLQMDGVKDIILDWDGTCSRWGDERWMEGYIEAMRDEFNILLTEADVFNMIRASKKESDVYTKFVYEKLSKNDMVTNCEEIMSYKEIKDRVNRVILKMSIKCDLFNGFLDLVKLCKSKGVRLHIYTMRDEGLIKEEIHERGLLKYFDTVNGSTEDLKKKDKNAIARKISGIKPETTLVIGNGRFDIKMARDFNCYCIGVSFEEIDVSYKKEVHTRNQETGFLIAGYLVRMNDKDRDIKPAPKENSYTRTA